MKRWHLAVKTGTEPMQREMGKRVKEAWQKAQTDINYKNQENFMNDIRLARIKEINELNIGHFIIGEAISIGIKETIKKMQNIIDQARTLHTG